MTEVVLAGLAIVAGLGLLTKAADVFVVAAEGIALHLRWSPAVIGAIVVGFGTSLPELVTSADAALAGAPALALGNAAGSNVANLLLILGVAALIAPIRAEGRGPGRDVLIATVGGAALLALSIDGRIGALDGIVLLTLLLASIGWQLAIGRSAPLEAAVEASAPALAGRALLGLIGVIVGARLLVWGATTVATELGVPTIVIGSVLVAIGTSLPELATAIASARRGQTALLFGNLIGSNTFNALGVVGTAALLGAGRGTALTVDLPGLVVVVAAALVTAGVGTWLWRAPRVGRVAAASLVVLYLASVPALLAVSGD